ncbi:MAG: hypothetical protein PHW96_02710 [Candidatus Nanoarchaeia archaeon]|nr:hypothetical protein [Candidatus Nanoarchaeia archaeon]
MKKKIWLITLLILSLAQPVFAQDGFVESLFNSYGNYVVRIIAGLLVAVPVFLGSKRIFERSGLPSGLREKYFVAGKIIAVTLAFITFFALPSSFVLDIYNYLSENPIAVAVGIITAVVVLTLVNRLVFSRLKTWDFRDRNNWAPAVIIICGVIIAVLIVLNVINPQLFSDTTPAGQVGILVRDTITAFVVIVLLIATFLIGRRESGSSSSRQRKTSDKEGLENLSEQVWEKGKNIIKKIVNLWLGEGVSYSMGLGSSLAPEKFEELKKDANAEKTLEALSEYIKQNIIDEVKLLNKNINIGINYGLKGNVKLPDADKKALKHINFFTKMAEKHAKRDYPRTVGDLSKLVSKMKKDIKNNKMDKYQEKYTSLVYGLGAILSSLDNKSIIRKEYPSNQFIDEKFYSEEKNKKAINMLKKYGIIYRLEGNRIFGRLVFDETTFLPILDEIFKNIYTTAVSVNKKEVNDSDSFIKELKKIRKEVEIAIRRVG